MTNKKLINVWHLDNTRDAGWAETPAAWPGGYTWVAQIEADDLDDAFRITNSIDSDWGTRRIRSSSVGDVFEVYGPGPDTWSRGDGVGHRIASAGFEAVSGHAGIENGRRR